MSDRFPGLPDQIEPNEESPQPCNQCLAIPDQYISLKCLHNLCLPCLALIYRQNPQEHSFQIVCPFDSCETVLDEFSIAALQKTLENVMRSENGIDQQENFRGSEMENPMVDSPIIQGANRMERRAEALKNERNSDIGNSGNGESQIYSNPAKEESREFATFCPKHRREPASLYCFTCESELLCVQCLVDGFHDQHDVKNLRKNPEFLSKRLESLTESLNSAKKGLTQWITELGSRQKIITNKVLEAKNQINADFRDLREKLNQKERELLAKCEDAAREKLRELEGELASAKEKYQNFALISEKSRSSFSQKPQPLEIALGTYKSLLANLAKGETRARHSENASEFKCHLNMESFYRYLEGIQVLKIEISGLSGQNNEERGQKSNVLQGNLMRNQGKSYLLPNNNSFVDVADIMGSFEEGLLEFKRKKEGDKACKLRTSFCEKKSPIFLRSAYEPLSLSSQNVLKRPSLGFMNKSTNSFMGGLENGNRASLSFMRKMKEASRILSRIRPSNSSEKVRLMNSLEKQRSLFEKNKNVS